MRSSLRFAWNRGLTELPRIMEIIEPRIQEYSERFTSPESDDLQALRIKTEKERGDKRMLSGFYQGRLLSMISTMIRPKRVLEIGTYMGYSALCLAEGLAPDGKVLTIDIEPETNAIAKEFWEKAGESDRIESYIGNALEIIATLDVELDLVFIDADKANYANYFDQVLPKTRIGGFIIADNVLWSGEVLDANSPDTRASAKALNAYNEKINADTRVSNILFAIRDGLMIARRDS